MEDIRTSNPSTIYGDQQKKILMMHDKGRNALRQSNEVHGSKGMSQGNVMMSHSKSASSLQRTNTTNSSKMPHQNSGYNKNQLSKT